MTHVVWRPSSQVHALYNERYLIQGTELIMIFLTELLFKCSINRHRKGFGEEKN